MRLLICDDERHILRLLQVNFERQGHMVATVDRGQMAIARLEQEPFDLAMIETDPTGVDGYDILAPIRT